ncbi:uncharacterized protein LOC123528643 [Mercenaria mercenaria]|uniref:uncharacterized protein LOC123528643 n=1 Tax=Mercenaria mercenaria TaxID=6596 RepID=UPI001E1E13BC|nr:uncharacterized protein LOC123528643 [Mercenaria mercenaria]XP_045164455.1 uncharacterized protein LOC123528643 [Mercenaria mercenaria]
MSDPGAPFVYSFGKMDSADDAYYSDMTSDISSVTSGPSHSCRQRQSYQKHNRVSKHQEQRMVEHGVGVMESHYDKENSSPDSDDPQSGNIFSFMRSGSGKVVLNKGTSLPTELEELDGESCDCHCIACCSCHSNRVKQGCYGHNCVCKKMSDGAECQNSVNKDLPSPTAIDSWGHFSKHKRNHYKYRRSDYSSDSEDEASSTLGKKSASNMTLLAKQKSHLPSITLTRQNSTSSSQSYDKSNCGSVDVFQLKEGVKPQDFKERVKTMVQWFSDFSDEQKNLVLKELLIGCELPQLHLLSVKMEANLHHGCPPNCQDLITWLPTNQATRILSYMDPVSLCRAAQVCKIWYQLSEEPSLWRRFCCQPKWRLCKAAEHKQVISHMSHGSIQWKKVFAERYRLRNNWLKGRCTVRTFEGHSQGISCVQFDDTRIVSGSSDKTIKVWNIRTNAQWSVQTLVGHSGTVRCLHLEGNRLVSGSTDCMIKVWDLSTQESWSSIACKVTMTGHSDTVRCLQVDDMKVISGSYDKTLKIWDLPTGRCKMTLRGHQAAVLCVHFNDTKVVSGSCDKTIKVWNYHGACMMTLSGHQDAVTCLQFDATRIVSGSLDCNLKFWDIHSGECINTIDWKAAEGHTGVVRCLQADSWRLVSAADDKTIKVWNLETGKRLVTLRNHTDGVTCLQFNDFIIVSGSYDKTVKLWDFSSC